MPPFIPTRRERLEPQSSGEKDSLFKAADKPTRPSKTLQDNQKFLNNLEDLEDESSLSEVSSQHSEDVLSPSLKRPKAAKSKKQEDEDGEADDDDDDDDDEIDWEDAIQRNTLLPSEPSRDLELTLDQNEHATRSFTDSHGKKKGPSKIEREIRISTHRMHVQFLLFHNLSRSRWACDADVQRILLDQLPTQIQLEVNKWRKDSGLTAFRMFSSPAVTVSKGKRGTIYPREERNQRNQRDWGKPAERFETGEPNMSAGDPIIRLLKCLSAYWRKSFTITAPGLRKQGYSTLPMLEEQIASFKRNDHDPKTHGERIDGVHGFRKAAKTLEGSRDLGAQLFTALLRGLGIEARLVASLQPIGFGWSKNENASDKMEIGITSRKKIGGSGSSSSHCDFDDDDDDDDENNTPSLPVIPKTKPSRGFPNFEQKLTDPKAEATTLSKNGKLISVEENDDDESVIDVTPASQPKKRNIQYDRDLPAPNYWTEVASPITFQIYPVDSLVSKIPVITSVEYLPHFEPRGIRADKAKQVFAYVVAFSQDGTAKDVTTRYLKRHLWPGRTKGVRLPPERIPIYNRNGKIKKHEEFDWFKTAMSGYERPHIKRTAADDLEAERDLKPAKFENKEANVREDTLQFYKSSAEFVLERHLRREEAIKPAAKPVRTFHSGKGANSKEEPVFRRQDIEVCRSGESWHKEGRAIKPREHPLKMVPVRAVTLTRKREVEEAERDSGEKQKQGLYARNQTDWIIPPPIENGRIPKNSYGNIDCFVPTMVPKGAVHIPLKKTVTICKKLGIDYAEAVTGFEFGNKMAVPVIEGVIVAEHHQNLVIHQWEKDEKERKIKEEGKREKMVLSTWRKWLMGLRIIQRVKEEYGGDLDAHVKEMKNPFTNQAKVRMANLEINTPQNEKGIQTTDVDEGEMGGGFLVDDDGDSEVLDPASRDNTEAYPNSRQLEIEDMEEFEGVPNRGLAILAANGIKGHFGNRDYSSESSNDGDESRMSRLNHESTESSKSLEKTSVNAETVRSGTPKYNQKRKASFSSPETSRRKTVRSIPKRNAARQSETAIRSHYFEHESDIDAMASSRQSKYSEKGHVVGTSLRAKRNQSPPSSTRSVRAKRTVKYA